MKANHIIATLGLAILASGTIQAANTGKAFYGDPPDDRHPWAIHDRNRPQPPRVEPKPASELAAKSKAPAGAVILFDGTEAALAQWEADKKDVHEPTKWIVRDGAMECVPKSGYVRTKQEFGDCQLHVEWAAPTPPQGESQGRGNSGIFLMGLLEVQVLDNYDNPTYADGFACSVYGINPPAANALRPPGEFQFVDIEFRRPIYENEKCVDPGYITVYCNGILVQDHLAPDGTGGHMKRSKPGPMPEKGVFKLQDHGNPVRFRNIWIRELPPRTGVTPSHGPLSAEETAAKRKEIAATIRADAAKLASPDNPLPELLRALESLTYEKQDAIVKKAAELTGKYLQQLGQLPKDKLAGKKGEVKDLGAALNYLDKWNLIPAGYGPRTDVDAFIKAQGWQDVPKAKK
ncbi:MAG: DUF1080 domain-containing protein [Verrucomicrobiota bacterium]